MVTLRRGLLTLAGLAWLALGPSPAGAVDAPPLITADLGDFRPELAGHSVTGHVEQGRFHPFPPITLPPAPPPPVKPASVERLALTKAGFEDLRGWREDPVEQALPALLASCRRIARVAADKPLGPNGMAGKAGDWRAPCAALSALTGTSSDAVRGVLEREFTPFRAASAPEPKPGLFTGYYEAALSGSRVPDARHSVPLYGRPGDIVTADLGEFSFAWRGRHLTGHVVGDHLKPYPTRAEIVAHGLGAAAKPLVWVDDPVEAFFMEVQGSGRVNLPDGEVIRVGYADQNGHAYVAIGKTLADQGAIPRDKVSLQTIRAWLRANPDQAPAVMATNPSYVFFRELGAVGPLGAEGVSLTPGRSLAVDPRFMPYGVPLWLDIDHASPSDPAPLRRLVVAQDTGGAIRGPVRGDVFWGFGPEAERRAGEMRQAGLYYLLLPNAVAARVKE